jgi:hypothetical protein
MVDNNGPMNSVIVIRVQQYHQVFRTGSYARIVLPAPAENAVNTLNRGLAQGGGPTDPVTPQFSQIAISPIDEGRGFQ